MWIPKAGTREYAAMQRAWQRRYPGRSMRDVTPATEYRVVRFAGGEIGGNGGMLVDWHVCDSRGRTDRVFGASKRQHNGKAMADAYARSLNVHLTRERMLSDAISV